MTIDDNNKVGSSIDNALAKRTVNVDTSIAKLNLYDDRDIAKAEVFLKKIMTTDKGGIKSVNEGLALLLRAQDLNLPFTACVEHVHVINGKTGVDIHVVKSLLLRAGVTWKLIKDYAPQYHYTDGNTIYNETQLPDYCVKCRTAKEAEDKTTDEIVGVYPLKWYVDLKGNIYNEFQVSDKCVIAINKVHAVKQANEGKFPIMRIPAQPVDYVTEYVFHRTIFRNGEKIEMTAKGRFSLSEATNAELLTKDTYKKYPRILVGVRAFTYGAREIGDDLLMGCMESGELKVIEKVPLDDTDFTPVEELN